MRKWAGGCNLGLPSLSFALRDSPDPLYLTNGFFVTDGLYVVALWQGCHSTSAFAWGPFWPPMPRPRLLLPLPTGGGGVGFPWRGGIMAE